MKELFNLSEDELLERIGESLESDELGMFPKMPNRHELKERAESWLRKNRELLQETICKNATIRSLGKSPEKDLAFHVVCEALTVALTGIHVGALTAYILVRGLDHLCASVK